MPVLSMGTNTDPSKIEPDPLALARIRLVVHMRPQDEDRFGVPLHKRMHTKISGRLRRGRKNGSRTAETHTSTQQRRGREEIPSTEHMALPFQCHQAQIFRGGSLELYCGKNAEAIGACLGMPGRS